MALLCPCPYPEVGVVVAAAAEACRHAWLGSSEGGYGAGVIRSRRGRALFPGLVSKTWARGCWRWAGRRAGGQVRWSSVVHERGEGVDEETDSGWYREYLTAK